MSADRFAEFEVCQTCKGHGHLGTGALYDPLRDCPTCDGDRVVLTAFEAAAREATKTTTVTLEDARDMLRKAADIEQPPALNYGNTLKRDGEAIGTFKTWLDCFGAAQAMSATYKRARFEAVGARGQKFTYRAGKVIHERP